MVAQIACVGEMLGAQVPVSLVLTPVSWILYCGGT